MKWSAIPAVVRLKARMRRLLYSRWFGGAVFVCLVVGTILWFVARERLPRKIQIATAEENGQYVLFGSVLADSMNERTRRDVIPVITSGSVDNRKRIVTGTADLAIIQHGAVEMNRLVVIAPLYKNVVHVVVRKGRGIASILDLDGRNVVLGREGSGMRASALEILNHYGVKSKTLGDESAKHFPDLANDESLDAAIVTTGYVNPDLKKLLASGEFELLTIDAAEAISIRHPHFSQSTIPQGLYGERPPTPDRPIKTVATTALLVARNDAPIPLVEEAVAALYEEYPTWQGEELPRPMTAADANQWRQLPLHPVTQTYFEPYKGLILLKDFMESMVATKDLLFTLGAGVYVLWLWRRKVVQRRNEAQLAVHIHRLNSLLDETICIEKEQMEIDDPKKLSDYLDEVTRIKLRALDELTDEDLRGDQMFSIFLTQCSNLSRKLQLKISLPINSQL